MSDAQQMAKNIVMGTLAVSVALISVATVGNFVVSYVATYSNKKLTNEKIELIKCQKEHLHLECEMARKNLSSKDEKKDTSKEEISALKKKTDALESCVSNLYDKYGNRADNSNKDSEIPKKQQPETVVDNEDEPSVLQSACNAFIHPVDTFFKPPQEKKTIPLSEEKKLGDPIHNIFNERILVYKNSEEGNLFYIKRTDGSKSKIDNINILARNGEIKKLQQLDNKHAGCFVHSSDNRNYIFLINDKGEMVAVDNDDQHIREGKFEDAVCVRAGKPKNESSGMWGNLWNLARSAIGFGSSGNEENALRITYMHKNKGYVYHLFGDGSMVFVGECELKQPDLAMAPTVKSDNPETIGEKPHVEFVTAGYQTDQEEITDGDEDKSKEQNGYEEDKTKEEKTEEIVGEGNQVGE